MKAIIALILILKTTAIDNKDIEDEIKMYVEATEDIQQLIKSEV